MAKINSQVNAVYSFARGITGAWKNLSLSHLVSVVHNWKEKGNADYQTKLGNIALGLKNLKERVSTEEEKAIFVFLVNEVRSNGFEPSYYTAGKKGKKTSVFVPDLSLASLFDTL